MTDYGDLLAGMQDPDPEDADTPGGQTEGLAKKPSAAPELSKVSRVFDLYHQRGWPVFPLPYGQKSPPMAGRTGRHGTDLTRDELIEWGQRSELSNFGIRMPRTDEWQVIGIDVDHDYGDKRGDDTLKAIEAALVKLPPAPSSTARGLDNLSRTRFFRCRPDVELKGVLKFEGKSDIEIIQHHHRFSAVSPSKHPKGGRYTWYDEHGVAMARPPGTGDLPWLSDTWVEHFKQPVKEVKERPDRPVGEVVTEYREQLQRTSTGEGMCPTMKRALNSLRVVGARHDAYRDHLFLITMLAAEGHQGVDAAVDTLRAWWTEVMAGEGSERVEGEFDRMVEGGFGRAAG
jgi:hypothetical protein